MSGALAVGGTDFLPETLLKLLLVWLLADPLLGVVWDAGVGSDSPAGQRGIWRRLLNPCLPDVAPPVRLLPYTQVGSPGHRLASHLGRLRRWWGAKLWPEAGREFATLVAVLGLALVLSAVLGRTVLALVLLCIALSWLAVLSHDRDTASGAAQPPSSRKGILALWHALGQFGTPWLIGATVMGGPSWAVILLGICFTITYFGLIHDTGDFRLIGTSQVSAALLLAGLRHPLSAGAMAILLMPQWGLWVWTDMRPKDHLAVPGTYLRIVQPFIILSMLLAALALAF